MNSPRAQRALNSSRRIKEYSRPFTSPGRGARVVYETDKWSCRSFWSRALTSVDLPAPEGATMMNTLPVMLPALMAHDRRGERVEHFSVDWPKERARRQYAQYGEREATQGKSLKNALDAGALRAL